MADTGSVLREAMGHDLPTDAVSRWIGHSITVSGRHYANAVLDELYAKASASPTEKAAHNPAQKVHERAEKSRLEKRLPTPPITVIPVVSRTCRRFSEVPKSSQNGAGGGARPPALGE